MKKTLLQQALSAKFAKRKSDDISDEHVELALAWARGEIGLVQVSSVLYKGAQSRGKGANVYVHLARALRKYIIDQNEV